MLNISSSLNMSTIVAFIKGIANISLIPIRVGMDKSSESLVNLTNVEQMNNKRETEIVRRYDSRNIFTDHIVSFSPPTEVYPGLFLGSSYNAAYLSCLRARNIKYIVNVTTEISNYYPKNIVYHNVPIRDNNSDSILQYLDESFNIIDEFLNKGNGNVLVHCYMGASRSAAVVINYISKKNGEDIDDVIDRLKKQRSCVNPTLSLIKDLNDSRDDIV